MSDKIEYLVNGEIPKPMTIFEEKILLNQMAILNALCCAPFIHAATAESLSAAFNSTSRLLKLANEAERLKE